MSPRSEGLLEKGLWEPSKADSLPPSATKRSVSKRSVSKLFNFIRPCFLKKTGARSGKLRRTAYLDGLRGFAAFMVYWGHHQLWAHDSMRPDRILENGFGYDRQYYFACFPIIRNFFSGGHFAVSVFFVISGYVLSAKPLQLIHSRQYEQLGDNLASALFRRWLRLHIPIIFTTFATLSLWHVFGILANFEPQHSYRAEIWKWYVEFKNFSFAFRTGGDPWFNYSFHVWSIPVEFRGSLIIYTALMAFSRCTRNARLWCELVLIYYFMYIVDGAHFSMFVMGMLLCDLDLLAADNDLPAWFSKLSSIKTYIFGSLFTIALFLGGSPSYSSDTQVLRETPGWYYLSYLKPQAVFDYKWFYLFWAATFLISSVPHLPWLKAFFETRFNQYLGRISFAFYLVHGPLLWTLGDRIYAATGFTRESHALGLPGWVNKFPIPKTPPFGMELAFLVPHLILLPVNFWLAEIVTTMIDEPTMKFTQWLYGKMMGLDFREVQTEKKKVTFCQTFGHMRNPSAPV